MGSVAMMHKDVHQPTGEQQQEGQRAEHVHCVLVDENDGRDDAEANECGSSCKSWSIWTGSRHQRRALGRRVSDCALVGHVGHHP